MRHVTLQRATQTALITLGMLQIKDIHHEPIYTLENPWLDNRPWVSCIPADTYVVEKYDGFKFKDVFKVRGVPNRSGILFHKGNYEHQTTGCILLGLKSGILNDKPAVMHSGDAMDYFRKLMGRKAFTLTIEDRVKI